MPISVCRTVAVLFTTHEESGAVYGTIRKLKQEGFFSSYSMYDDYALIFVPVSEVDAVINALNNMATEKKMPGILAQED